MNKVIIIHCHKVSEHFRWISYEFLVEKIVIRKTLKALTLKHRVDIDKKNMATILYKNYIV